MSQKNHHNTPLIHQIDGTILSHQSHAGEQFVMRVAAEQIAKTATAGQFVHIQCDRLLKMRRPISIMRADASAGTIDLLYKAIGEGTRLLSQQKTGQSISLLGPIGKPFEVAPKFSKPLLIGGGVGMPPMIFLAEMLKDNRAFSPLVILGSEVPFPFNIEPSTVMVDGIDATGTMPLLADWGLACRLASGAGFTGVYQGFATDLARLWLDTLDDDVRAQVKIYSCGPSAMLRAVHDLAVEFAIPCDVSLEEYMACAVGGCAGCTIEVKTPNGPAMKRVCVDGPVFSSDVIF